jgi:hypothetical protein
MSGTASRILEKAWAVVEAGGGANSAGRTRWEEQRLSVTDLALVTVAAVCVGALLSLAALVLRLLCMGMQVLGGVWAVFRIVAGF